MRSIRHALALSALVSLVGGGSAFAQASPADSPGSQPGLAFRFGFGDLAAQIPDIVGQPVEEEHYGANGDSLQQSTTGLMVWRKADNWTAFTDGVTTWINGPAGVQSRDNNARLSWETVAQAAPQESREITLFDRRNVATAYVALDDESTIYLWTGEPVAYLYGEHIYGFNGRHLGWFEDDTVWDWETVAVGFTREAMGEIPVVEPPKDPRLQKPARLEREEAPAQRSRAFVFTKMLSTVLRWGEIR